MLPKELIQLLQLFGHLLQALHTRADLLGAVPEQALGASQLTQPQVAELEQAAALLERGLRVVPGLLHVLGLDAQPRVVELADDAVATLPRLLRLAEAQVVHTERVEHQHGLVRRHGTPALADDGGVRHACLLAGVLHRRHHVVGVLLHAIVHGRAEVGAAAVVVHREATAHVDVAHLAAQLHELRVHLGRFAHGVLDRHDAADLAADVEVQQPQAVEHAALLQAVHHLHHLGRGEAELGLVASGRGPAPHALAAELGAHAERGPDAQVFEGAEDDVQLLDALEHHHDRVVEALRHERGLDVAAVLVAVADDEAVFVVHGRERDQQLGLAAGLEAVAVGATRLHHLFDEVALLVDLDGEHAAVDPVVFVLVDGLLEALVDETNAVLEDAREADEQRQVQPARTQLHRQLVEVDVGLFARVRRDRHVPSFVDVEVGLPPAADLVQLGALLDAPGVVGGEGLVVLVVGHEEARSSTGTPADLHRSFDRWLLSPLILYPVRPFSLGRPCTPRTLTVAQPRSSYVITRPSC
jgi:hypothetical protein